MEIFIATSIKSFDLNPTHPGPLPRASFHTSANQIERESKAARGIAKIEQRPRRIDKRQAMGCKGTRKLRTVTSDS